MVDEFKNIWSDVACVAINAMEKEDETFRKKIQIGQRGSRAP